MELKVTVLFVIFIFLEVPFGYKLLLTYMLCNAPLILQFKNSKIIFLDFIGLYNPYDCILFLNIVGSDRVEYVDYPA